MIGAINSCYPAKDEKEKAKNGMSKKRFSRWHSARDVRVVTAKVFDDQAVVKAPPPYETHRFKDLPVVQGHYAVIKDESMQ